MAFICALADLAMAKEIHFLPKKKDEVEKLLCNKSSRNLLMLAFQRNLKKREYAQPRHSLKRKPPLRLFLNEQEQTA